MSYLSSYDVILFDCDGVLLNSNELKSDAFYQSTLVYGKASAEKFLEYHKKNGGISRFEKFKFFLSNIVENSDKKYGYDYLLSEYKKHVLSGMSNCQSTQLLGQYRELCADNCWAVISGGAEEELKDVFENKGWASYFNWGIHGSPSDKESIIKERILPKVSLDARVLFIGDSRYDYQVASKFNFDFIFLSDWTDFQDWKCFFLDKPEVLVLRTLDELLQK